MRDYIYVLIDKNVLQEEEPSHEIAKTQQYDLFSYCIVLLVFKYAEKPTILCCGVSSFLRFITAISLHEKIRLEMGKIIGME